MTYENIKTTILTLLVVVSTLLTWFIWTYQPNYETMENGKTVEGVSLGEQKEIKEIIKPDQIYYHTENYHYGTVNRIEIDKVIKELRRWNFDHFADVSSEIENMSDFLYAGGNTEIIFPDRVPMEIYKNVLDIKDKDAFSIQFDRIIIDVNNIEKENGFVYFLSADRNLAYKSEVTASFVTNFKEDYYQTAASNPKYTNYTLQPLTEDRSLLVQTEKSTMFVYNYLLDPLPTGKFKDALFSDPDFVQQNYTSSGEEYFDESTLLSVNYNTNTIMYVNPAQENGAAINIYKLLQQSIDFINGHGGWTGNYLYVGLDELEKTVLFRLYDLDGYPIFNNNGMSEILEIWGETEINQYIRNNFSLGRRVESTEVTVKSGVEILELLKNKEDFNLEFLQELVLGYEMTQNVEGTLIHLEPVWYYKYKDQWWVAPSDAKGGLNNGLE